MSPDNVAVMRRFVEGAGRQDLPAALAELDPGIEIEDTDIPDAEDYRGHQGFLKWIERWNEGWQSWTIEGLEVRPVGANDVIALFQMSATGEGSGIELRRDDAMVGSIRNGKIVQLTYYNDQALALRALGLNE